MLKQKYEQWTKEFMDSWKALDWKRTLKTLSEDVEYYENPIDKPCANFEEVIKLWNVVADNQKDIEYKFEILSFDENNIEQDMVIVQGNAFRDDHEEIVRANELGLKPGTPISYRAGDQPNNALSLNVFNPGEIASTAGTSGVVYGVLGDVNYDNKSRVNTFAHVNNTAEQARLGVLLCINGAGILNAWIRRNVAPDGIGYAEMNDLAADIPIGSDGVCVIPFGNGAERVLENKEMGCSISGINFNKHGKAHIVRAAQEGIVFSFCYGMEIMQQMGMNINKIHR